jgi:hypothetical protein
MRPISPVVRTMPKIRNARIPDIPPAALHIGMMDISSSRPLTSPDAPVPSLPSPRRQHRNAVRNRGCRGNPQCVLPASRIGRQLTAQTGRQQAGLHFRAHWAWRVRRGEVPATDEIRSGNSTAATVETENSTPSRAAALASPAPPPTVVWRDLILYRLFDPADFGEAAFLRSTKAGTLGNQLRFLRDAAPVASDLIALGLQLRGLLMSSTMAPSAAGATPSNCRTRVRDRYT